MGDRSACTSPAPARRAPLYDARLHERDACGIGFVADLHGRPSRAMVEHALEGLERLRHRGAVAADARTGDGAGLLLPIDQEFYAAPVQGKGPLGLAMAFLPADRDQAKTAMVAVERALVAEGLELERWRPVPVDPEALGDQARASMPAIEQAVFRAPGASDEEAERRCLRAGRRAVADGRAAGAHLYLASCSTRTVTYKALCAADQLAAFYTDLADERLRAPFAIFHQRYSTNTTPSWERAQPFRFLCHNGEINTLEGNRAWMRAREGSLGAAALAGPDGTDPEGLLRPVLDPDGSDSAMLDNAVELLVRGGRDVRHALTMLVPAAVEQDPEASDELRDFYRYHACLTEPWDGPAGLVFTDGRVVGATLDRNGLRPLRYEVCEDGLVVCASEVGAIDVAGHGAVRRGRLGPGQMLCVNPNAGRASAMDSSTADEPEDGSMRAAHVRPAFADAGLQTDVDIKEALARSRPWSDWLAAHLRAAPLGEPMPVPEEDLTAAQVAFGFTRELISTVLRPMATGGKEPTASMGDDTPPAVLAATARPVSHYLRQRFAQVTNPPIDHLRERHVLSKRTLLGPRSPLLSELPEAARLIELETFLLTPDGVERLLEMAAAGRPGTEAAAAGRLPFTARVLDATWPVDEGPAGLRAACRRLGDEAAAAVRGGAGLLVVRDHAGGDGSGRAPVPALLAIGAVQHRLVRAGLATAASLVADTCEPVDAHHAAALLGYGAGAICPRLGLATAASLAKDGDAAAAQARYLHAVEEGVFKVMSKMGISTLDSYRGAQIFEAVGLDAEVVGVCFAGTASPLGGIGFDELGEDVLARHAAAGAEAVRLDNPGWFKHRPGGEYHATNPEVMQALHHTVREDAELRGSKRSRAAPSSATSTSRNWSTSAGPRRCATCWPSSRRAHPCRWTRSSPPPGSCDGSQPRR
jgi:glutamate synthase domain-containing protein 1